MPRPLARCPKAAVAVAAAIASASASASASAAEPRAQRLHQRRRLIVRAHNLRKQNAEEFLGNGARIEGNLGGSRGDEGNLGGGEGRGHLGRATEQCDKRRLLPE